MYVLEKRVNVLNGECSRIGWRGILNGKIGDR
jgi:hypothetical protein